MKTEPKTGENIEEETKTCCGGGSCNDKEKASGHCGQQCEQKTLTVEELTDLLKRTQANFDNYRKQMQAYMEEIKKMASKEIVLQLLPAIDNFELALKSQPADSDAVKEFIGGMQLIHAQLMKVLEENNVAVIESLGKKYDPYLHEALMKAPSDKEANMILEEFQKGYLMQGKVLRHAKVKVSAGKLADIKLTDTKENKENKRQDTEEE